MRNYRQKKRIENLGIAGVVFMFCLVIVAMPFAFKWLDCRNATNNLAFIKACEEDNNCTLNARDLRMYKSYVRLELTSCPK